MPVKVLFVCMGNICRSPTAEGVFRKIVAEAGLDGHIEIDSCGTGGWHVGEPPDPRAQREAAGRGIDISGLRGRQVHRSDFDRFDYVLAMDTLNRGELERHCPPDQQHKIHMCLDFAWNTTERDVPDPYYGGDDGFVHVYNLVEDACAGLLGRIRGDHNI